MDEFEGKTLEEIKAFAAAGRETLAGLFAIESPTSDQIAEAKTLAASVKTAEGLVAEQEQALAAEAAEFAALREEFTASEDEGDDDDAEEGDDDEDDEDGEAEPDEGVEVEDETENDDAEEAPVDSVEAKATVRTLSRKTKRPKAPALLRKSPILVASADVPDFATGARMDGMGDWAKATLNRAKGFPRHSESLASKVREQTGQTQQLHKFGTASMQLDFPDEVTVKRGSDDYSIFETARDWRRVESKQGAKGLTAAGGWCAPSETIYDLCDIEVLDGILSIAEFGVQRGGINHTKGPTFADVFDDGDFGFLQTEADAIAGETKDCMTISCPDFEEIRLDAIGYCVKVPILTEVGYPELIRRYLQLATIAYERKKNKETITRILAGSTAKSVTGLGAVVTDTLEGLEILADQWRSSFALSLNHPFEVKVPHWVRGAYRSDLARRNGMLAQEQVTEQMLTAHFATRNLTVQFIFDLQAGPTGTTYPDTYLALMYPAGQWARGMADVISLSTVYDAASLQVNTYTGVFFEQGMLLADGCYDSYKVTLPICTAGQSGAAALVCDGS